MPSKGINSSQQQPKTLLFSISSLLIWLDKCSLKSINVDMFSSNFKWKNGKSGDFRGNESGEDVWRGQIKRQKKWIIFYLS